MAVLIRARLGMIALALAGTAGAAQPVPLEYAVKANFLSKFAPFVEWPAHAFASPTAPLLICLAGPDPFGTALDDAVKGQQAGDHPLAVRRGVTAANVAGCHILFVRPEQKDSREVLEAVAGRPVLTVTEGGRATGPAVVRFVIRDRRVRFEIDGAAAQGGGIVISSKLLGLAVPSRPDAR